MTPQHPCDHYALGKGIRRYCGICGADLLTPVKPPTPRKMKIVAAVVVTMATIDAFALWFLVNHRQ